MDKKLASIFRAYDVRGIINKELTPAVAEAAGRAFADWLPSEGAVCVGYDMRSDSHELAAAVRAGLTRQGRDVIDIGEVSSDMIYFAVGSLRAAGGMMVTASHNPGAYNGIKFCREEARPVSIETGLAEIRDAVLAEQYNDAPEPGEPGEIVQRDIMDAWVDHALRFVRVESWPPYHIAVDAGNGMAGEVMPHLDGKWPLQTEPMFYELDGTFPNHLANPLIEENNRFIAAKIRDAGLDFGLAFDGDADRAFLLDENGKTVPGHIMTVILAEHFLKLYPGSNIVYSGISSRLVPEVVTERGGTPIRSRVGHSFVKQLMREYDAPFGGEFSGHFYFRDNYYADSGLIGALVGIQVLRDSGKKLSELVAEYASRYARSPEINAEVADAAAVVERLKTEYADGVQDEFDGLTVSYTDWWFNVRMSANEPLVRLNVEARTAEQLAEKTAELRKKIEG